MSAETAGRGTTYAEVFADREFRALWASQVISVVGDQVGRVAVSVLVFARTGSPALTAFVYALSFLPWVVGGPLLGGLADRCARRTVLLACDGLRAVLLAAMALPGLNLGVLVALLLAVEMAAAPYNAARAALLPDMLSGDRYVLGVAVQTMTAETGQLLGFLAAGGVVLAVSARGALLLDALSFLLSAVLVASGVRRRPPALHAEQRPSLWQDAGTGLQIVLSDPRLRRLALLAWVCAFYVVPEGLAVPLAHASGAGPGSAGLLLAANPAGTLIGSLVLGRYVAPELRLRLLTPLAVLSVAPLLACALRPPLPVTLALIVLSGLGSAYNLPASAAFVTELTPETRGRAIALVNTGMSVGQGLAIVLGGVAASHLSPFTVVAVAGGLGLLVVLGNGRAEEVAPMRSKQ